MLEFVFLLARELKYTVADLLDSLGDGELDFWFELHKRQPIGNDWYQTGLLCSTFANFNAWGLKKPTAPEDFMPRIVEPATVEQLERQFLAAFAALGKVPVAA